MSALLVLLVALAGGLGAGARYVLDFAILQHVRKLRGTGRDAPVGILVVNVIGSLGLGLLVGASMRLELPAAMSVVIGGGFFGAFTTFSTWMYESVRLVEQGRWRLAATNIAGSLAIGIAAAGCGIWLGMVFAEAAAGAADSTMF